MFGGVRNVGIVNSVLAVSLMLFIWQVYGLTLSRSLIVMLVVSILVVLIGLFRLMHHPALACGESDSIKLASLKPRRALREGWPLCVAMLCSTMHAAGAAWLASFVDITSHVALFGIATRALALIVAPMVVVNAVLPPIVARQYSSGDLVGMGRLVRTVSCIMLVPLLIFIGIVVVDGRPLLGLAFGDYYQASYPLLLVLCLGQVANFSTGAWQVVLPMTGARFEALLSSGLGLLVLAIVGAIAGGRFGVLGVALAVALSNVSSNLVGMYLVRRKLGIWTFAYLDSATWRYGISALRGYLLGVGQ